ncbi:unnamed protein product [Miscanthus lutarioriparius]|uniref:Uncharacterized protein n=1 Tax=Miscanthus lutarioriparius TaxID=422564 RepID=A0A811PUE6_9POAL|nr:unnamed protein product [Miscanthus lutarioriparius]
MTLFEAEAVSICRFLRPATHVLGYSVVDQNYPTLAKLVSEMNRYNEQIAELQTCADKAVGMLKQRFSRPGLHLRESWFFPDAFDGADAGGLS